MLQITQVKNQRGVPGVLLSIREGEGTSQIGQMQVVYKDETGRIELRGASYAIKMIDGAKREKLYQIVWRLLRGQPKPLPVTYELVDAQGKVLALAEEKSATQAMITCDSRRYRFTKRGLTGRHWDLYDENGTDPIGSVGHDHLFARTSTIELPAVLAEAVQVFLFWTRLAITAAAAANSDSAN